MDDPIFTDALALLRQAIDEVHGHMPKEYREFDLPAIELTALKMMRQSISRCDSIHLLLTEGLLEDATILLRSLMWDAQRLIYMDQHPKDRISLLLTLENKKTNNMEGQANIAKELDLDVTIMRKEVTKRRREYEKARLAYGAGKPKTFPEGEGMARSIGRLTDVLGHKMYSASTHGAALSVFSNVAIGEGGKLKLLSRNKSPGYVSGVAWSASEYLFEGVIATAKAQGWNTVDQLRELYAETNGEFERLRERKGESTE